MTTSGFNRREFTLALAGSAAFTADRVTVGQDVPTSKTDVDLKTDDQSGSDQQPTNEESRELPSEAAYLLGLIMRRYPDDRLDETAVSGIVRDIYGDLARSRALSSFPLENSDEPGFVFKAWRAD